MANLPAIVLGSDLAGQQQITSSDTLLVGGGIDASAAGALVLGASTATSVALISASDFEFLSDGSLKLGGVAGTVGQVITSDGSSVPSWAAAAASSAQKVSFTGFTTTDLAEGDFVYTPTTTPLKTDALVYEKAIVAGAYEGTSGSLTVGGQIDNAKFTTAGGQPEDGEPVYLAKSTDDTDTGAGKLTATAPTARGQYVAEVGICYDNSNYASAKTCSIIFNPKVVIAL
jgi:hypothetical protein